MEKNRYLNRIGYTGPVEATTAALNQLHKGHLFSVPFENLDIFLGRPIVLTLQSFYDKVVYNNRGGYCYELNGLFGWLLTAFGFNVTMLSARVFDKGSIGPEFDHMVLLVEAEKPLIADVGFGDSFIEPIGFDEASSLQQGYFYRLKESDSQWVLQRRDMESDWDPLYIFSLEPRKLEDFSGMNVYHQTSEDSHFTRQPLCTKATTEGRITLLNNRLIVTSGDDRNETPVTMASGYISMLKKYLGIDLEETDARNFMRHAGTDADTFTV